MFEFTWPIDLRYCSYDTAPLSNREMLALIMLESDVDPQELAVLLQVSEQSVHDWLEGQVRPRYRDLDRVAEVCHYDVGPGFGQIYDEEPLDELSELLGDDEYGLVVGTHREYDPDPEGHDREDMNSVGWFEMHMPPHWEVGFADLKADLTHGRSAPSVTLDNDVLAGSRTATFMAWTPSSPRRNFATTSARCSVAPRRVSA